MISPIMRRCTIPIIIAALVTCKVLFIGVRSIRYYSVVSLPWFPSYCMSYIYVPLVAIVRIVDAPTKMMMRITTKMMIILLLIQKRCHIMWPNIPMGTGVGGTGGHRGMIWFDSCRHRDQPMRPHRVPTIR